MFRSAFSRAIALAVASTASGVCADPVTLAFGGEGIRRASIVFGDDRAAPDALVIETQRAGNPGAQLRIWIDKSSTPLVDKILTSVECSFGDAGATCRLEIDGGSDEYARFVTSFTHGLVARIEVQNAGVMEMTDDISLIGFAAAYGR